MSGPLRRGLAVAMLAVWGVACAGGPEAEDGPIDNSFLYVPNQWTDNVSAFAIDTSTGALRPVPGSPFAAGDGAKWVAVGPSGGYAYVANYEAGTISAFAIDAATGALHPVAGSPFLAKPYVAFLAVHPSGKFLYAANSYSCSFSAFAIDAATGALSHIGSFAVGTGHPSCIAFDPAGRYLYLTDEFVRVYGYSVDAASGWPEPIQGLPLTTGGIYPSYLAVDRAGAFAYVTNIYSRFVDVLAIDAATGTLSPIPGSPFALRNDPAGTASVVIDPSGRFAYVVNLDSSYFSIFAIDGTTGAMTEIPDSPFRFQMDPFPGPFLMAIHPEGRFAYVSNFFSDQVAAYSLDASTGGMTQLAGSPYPVGEEPVGLAIARVRR
jgi:6-phosphogluconolactonase (cycloisomerase 2 family)